MKAFRYGGDFLCIGACAAYAVNAWLLPASWRTTFLRDHFNDVLLVPAAFPFILWLQRRLGLRPHDQPPGWGEIAFAVVLWSIAAEAVAPNIFTGATADWRDIFAYAAGASVAGLWWRR